MKHCIFVLLLLVMIEETVAGKSIQEFKELIQTQLEKDSESKTDKFVGVLTQLLKYSYEIGLRRPTKEEYEKKEYMFKRVKGMDSSWDKDKVFWFWHSCLYVDPSFNVPVALFNNSS